MTIYESSSKHNILMYKTFFSFSISHCMVSALIDCLRRPNTSLPPLNTRSIPTSVDGTGRKSRTAWAIKGYANVFTFHHFSTHSGDHWWDQLTGGDSIYLSISEAMIAWEGWTLQSVFHIASDIPDGPPDCAETVASNGYSLKKDRTSPMMCSASDSLICAAKKVVSMWTYCKRLSMGLTI